MSAKLFLGIRDSPTSFQRVELSEINLNNNVKSLKDEAAKSASFTCDQMELTFCGNILKDSQTLTEAGLRSGVTVHVLKKKPPPAGPKKKEAFFSDEKNRMVSAFKMAVRHPNYRAAILRLVRPESLENIIAATPGLRDDPYALAMLHDPELMAHFCDRSSVAKAIEAHPALAEAAQYIATVIHDEAASPSAAAAPSSGYLYTLEALSDDDDMESSQSSDSQMQTAESSFNSSITSSQLAAALAAITPTAGGTTSSSSEQTAGGTAGLITPEMVGAALGQAFATSSSQQSTPVAAAPPAVNRTMEELEGPSRRLAQHMQQMRELGLRDDTLNLQALMATDWNVQEAIDLVFSGAMNDIDPEDE